MSPAGGKKSWPPLRRSFAKLLCDYAVELRKLAYTLPNGVGEHDLLWLSERMHTAANQVVPKGA